MALKDGRARWSKSERTGVSMRIQYLCFSARVRGTHYRAIAPACDEVSRWSSRGCSGILSIATTVLSGMNIRRLRQRVKEDSQCCCIWDTSQCQRLSPQSAVVFHSTPNHVLRAHFARPSSRKIHPKSRQRAYLLQPQVIPAWFSNA